YTLWPAIAAALVLAILFWRYRAPARIIAPASFLWLWTVPYLPWLGARFPMLLLLAGPPKWFIAGAVVVATVHRAPLKPDTTYVGSRTEVVSGFSQTLPSRSAAVAVFLLSFALYAVCGLRSFDRIGISGDEPHYLVITHSVLVDHDLQIENNHTRGDYRAF